MQKNQRKKCTNCGLQIMKSGLYDSFICRECENENLTVGEKYYHLNVTGN